MKREKLVQEIRSVSERGKIVMPPRPYTNTIQNFFFSDDEVLEANDKGNLLKLDLDVGKSCNLNCGFCYVNTQNPDSEDYIRTTTERVKGIIDEGIDLGLKTIKVVGAGEPFLFRGLLDILEHAEEKGVGTLVFTAGHIIGNDNLAKKIFKKEGVESGEDLISRLEDFRTSVVVKYNTFDDELQNELVAAGSSIKDYAKVRDRGLLRLVKRGFNSHTPTRLGVDVLLLESNYQEAKDIFSAFNRANVFVLMKTPVDCGGTSSEKGYGDLLTGEHAIEAAKRVYEYCKDAGIPMNPESPYFGGPPCSQLNHSMHIGDNGAVKHCPGDKGMIEFYKPGNLKDIWEKNSNRRIYAMKTSHHCPPRKGYTMPHRFSEVMSV